MQYFYYFGFVYIFNTLWDIYETIKNKKTPLDTLNEVLPEGESPEEILKVRYKVFSKKTFLYSIVDFMCLGWIIIGIAFAVESPIFIFNLVISWSVYLVGIIYAISYFIKNKNRFIQDIMTDIKGAFKKIAAEVPDMKNIHVANYGLKLIIISYVLYSHFIH